MMSECLPHCHLCNLASASGSGRERYTSGSNVIDVWLQEGHMSVDLYRPVKRSTTIESFLLL